MLANTLHALMGVPENFVTFLIIIVAITAIFTWSASSGISKAFRSFPNCAFIFALPYWVIVSFFGNTLFQVENTVQSLGLSLQNFIQMLFYLDPSEPAAGSLRNGPYFIGHGGWGLLLLCGFLLRNAPPVVPSAPSSVQ